MESSTQDDSLVFASDPKRHLSHQWSWSQPKKSEPSFEETVADEATTPSNENDTLSFSEADHNESEPASPVARAQKHSVNDTPMVLSLFSGADTQVIPQKEVESVLFNSTANDGLLSTGSSVGVINNIPHERPSEIYSDNCESEVADTQVIVPRSLPEDTRRSENTINPFQYKDQPPDTSISETENDVTDQDVFIDSLDYGDTQNITSKKSSPKATLHSSSLHGYKRSPTEPADTQVIERRPSVDDIDNSDSSSQPPNTAQTQTPFLTKHTIPQFHQDLPDTSGALIDSSPSKLENTPRPVGGAVVGLVNSTGIQHTAEEYKSQNPSEIFQRTPDTGNMTFDVSFQNSPTMEPTTQVLNTQEDNIEVEIAQQVDLGCKPIFSSSQTDEQKTSRGVPSNEDMVESEEETSLYTHEDSLFRVKRRKIAWNPQSQSDCNISAKSCPTTSRVFEQEEREMDAKKKGEESINNGTSRGRPSKPRKLSLSSSAFDEPNFKRNWSQSSSELEDVSHEVDELNLDALPGGSESVTEMPPSNALTRSFTSDLSRERLPISIKSVEEESSCLTHENILNPNAVWALSQFKQFPAKVLHAGEQESLVEFAGGAQSEVRNTDIHLLDLRVGDTVRVKSKTGDYVVTGLSTGSSGSLFKCIRGYNEVHVKRKGRHNIRKMEFQIPLSEISMEIEQWAAHQQSFQLLCDGRNLSLESYATVLKVLNLDFSLTIKQTAENILLSPKKQANGQSKSKLFTGMLFFVTSIEGAYKDKLKESISSHGGILVDEEIKDMMARTSLDSGKLTLTSPELSAFSFVALLSDGYSRSAKYLQALSLGWPILSHSFIHCALHDASVLKKWPNFTLPAGQAAFIDSIISSDVFSFRKNLNEGLNASHQLQNNSELLSDYVMLVLEKKQDAKMVDMCIFVCHAFGANSISLMKNVTAIDSVIREHSSSKKVLVFDNSVKEYYKSREKKSARTQYSKSRIKVGIVDWEWVVQCIISSLIWEPVHHVQL